MSLAYPHRGAGVGRFYKHRVTELFLRLLGKLFELLHLLVVDHQPFGHLDAVGLQDGVGDLLIHAVGAGDGVAAHKGDARQLEQALDGAVLAMLAVQHREADVYRHQLPALFGEQQHALVGAVRGDDGGAQGGVLLPLLAGDLIVAAGIFHPSAVLGDADAQHLIVVRQVCQHRLDRHQGDFMLTGNAAEQHGDPRFLFACHKSSSFLYRWDNPKQLLHTVVL